MLRIIEMSGAQAAKEYYTAALARADYYVAGTETVGTWRGRGAEILSLNDTPINQRTFGLLADNLHPHQQGERLTPRTSANRRVGYDFNFHVPKGVSVAHALLGDDRLPNVFLEVVRAIMAEAEQSMQARIRARAVSDSDRITGNWIYGEFLHFTTRPVTADGMPDPHMHCHCTVLNASYDGTEQRWKAGQFGSLVRDANYYEAAFHSRLAHAVVALGYRIERRGKYWDLAGVPESLIEKFAKRKSLIDKTAERRGITDAKAKDRLGAQTRAPKVKGVSSEELTYAWMSQLSATEIAALRTVRLKASVPHQGRGTGVTVVTAEASVNYALEHLYERQSVVSDRRIAEAALRHGVGQGIVVADVWREIERRAASKQLYSRQVDDQRLFTTQEAYDETTRCIDFTRDGMGCCRALAPSWEIKRPELLAASATDQLAAIQHVLASTNRVIGVRGRAGTGKTFATQEIATALAATGRRLQALAPTSKAVDVLRGEGFAGADTVSQLLVNPQLQQSITDGVLLVDEAGLLSNRQLDRLFQIAADQNCRVLLQYDLGQHRSVERGSPVRDLERYAGLRSAEIHVVRRQKPADYKAAVSDLVHGRIDKAFARLKAMEAFVEVADPGERQQRLANDYVTAARRPGAKVLVVSPTHQEGSAVTKAIRSALRKAGRLKKDERETLILQRCGLTAAQRGESISYGLGQVVQFTQNTVGHQRGERFVVKERLPDGTVLVQQSTPSGLGAGAAFALHLADKDSFDLYEPRRIGLSVGDRIRITQNGYVPILNADGTSQGHDGEQEQPGEKKPRDSRGKKKPQRRLINNATYQIKRFTTNGDLVLNNGWVLPRSYGHLTYGYCTTSHASQGITADTVLISQSAESFGASSREQFYVSCSRGKTGIKIYTDSVAELSRAVARSDQQISAADLLATLPAPQQLSSPLPTVQDGRSRANRDRQVDRMAIACALGNAKNLRIKIENGISVISSLKRMQLRIGGKEEQSVIVTEDQTRYVDSVFERGRWICGPPRPAELAPPLSLDRSNVSTLKTVGINAVSSASLAAPLSVDPIHPQPDYSSQSPSI